MQTFVNRYVGLLRNDSRDDSSAEILSTMQNVKLFVDSISNNLTEQTLHIDGLYTECSKRLMNRPEKLKPIQLIEVLDSVSVSAAARSRLIQDTLKVMRQDKYDIRQFNFSQLVTFVLAVADSQPQDLIVFKNYIDAAVIQNFFSDADLNSNFGSLIDLLHAYALANEMDDGAAMLKFMVMLKQQIYTGDLSPHTSSKLIGIIWTLISREISLVQKQGQLQTSDQNPLIPRLLEYLYSYKPGRELTRIEQLQLFQINLWIQEKLEDKRLPEVFANCIPQSVLEKAEDRFHEYDQSRYVEE